MVKKMATNSNAVGTILASVFITMILSGTGMYFGLPLVYPDLTDMATEDDLDDYVLKNETLNKEVVIQTKYKESNSTIAIFDDDVDPSVMPGMEMNITTQGNTKLSVSFDAQIELTLCDNFEMESMYNITLQIEGVKQETVRILEYHENPIDGEMRKSLYVQISFETGILPASTYNISVLWSSQYDTFVTSRLTSAIYYDDNLIRSITAQEIKV